MAMPYLGDFCITKLYGTLPPKGVTYAAGKHAGVDLVGVASKEIRAIAPGTVHRVGFDANGWGRYITIKQSDGLFAIYCHCKSIHKTAGQVVRAGDWIATEGATGQVTGAHLHLELRKVYDNNKSTIDPLEYLELVNKVGHAKVVSELVIKTTILLNGVAKVVDAIEKEGNNYVKLQDLRDSQIAIGYSGGKPTVSVIKK